MLTFRNTSSIVQKIASEQLDVKTPLMSSSRAPRDDKGHWEGFIGDVVLINLSCCVWFLNLLLGLHTYFCWPFILLNILFYSSKYSPVKTVALKSFLSSIVLVLVHETSENYLSIMRSWEDTWTLGAPELQSQRYKVQYERWMLIVRFSIVYI